MGHLVIITNLLPTCKIKINSRGNEADRRLVGHGLLRLCQSEGEHVTSVASKFSGKMYSR